MAKGVARSTAEPMGWSKWLLRGHSALVYAFFYAPIAVLTFYSFNESQIVGRWTGFSMRWYGAARSMLGLRCGTAPARS